MSDELWHIHGKTYDLAPFLEKHPGGRDILEKTRGQKDSSALFETYHAFSNIQQIETTLQKYQVEGSDEEPMYDFTQYRQCVEQIRQLLPGRADIKAGWSWLLVNAVVLGIYVYALYFATSSTSHILIKCVAGVVAASCESSQFFTTLHDASHYAITTNPVTNELISKVWNSWTLWNTHLWFYHHVYYHHSFTGLQNDPDANIYDIWSIFNVKGNYYPGVQALYAFFPGQHYLQSIWYVIASFEHSSNVKRKEYRLPNIVYYEKEDLALMAVKLHCFWLMGLYPTVLYMMVHSFLYYINVFADHDLYESKVDNHYEGNNWFKMQVHNSAGFMQQNRWWATFFGGINYQIEHHLFPNMSHVHYAKIAPIVQEFCAAHNVKYVHYENLGDAYKSFQKSMNKVH
jgi:fatty acid desaturase